MTTKDKIRHIKAIVAAYRHADELTDQAINLGMLMPGKPFFEAIFKYPDALLRAFADAIGDEDGNLDWFIHDNDCGKKGLAAEWRAKDGRRQRFPITTVERLVAFMEGRRTR